MDGYVTFESQLTTGGHKATVKNVALSVCTDASAWNDAFISPEYGPGSESVSCI